MTTSVEIEALYGSASRGDIDDLSDRDFLIIDDDTPTLRERQRILKAEGWSAAAYTWKRFAALVDRGALFVQHLKQECNILKDRRGRFRAALSDFRPKPSYSEEMHANAELVSLVGTYPNSGRGALWAGDVLYVFLRNFGVLYLADHKRYVFSYRGILENLIDIGCMRSDQLIPLLKLRLMKVLYRSDESVSSARSKMLLAEALSAMPHKIFSRACIAVAPAGVIASLQPLGTSAQTYQRLRYLEKMYIALLEINPNSIADPSIARLKHWIEDPRSYASIAATHEIRLCYAIRGMVGRLDCVRQRSIQEASAQRAGVRKVS